MRNNNYSEVIERIKWPASICALMGIIVLPFLGVPAFFTRGEPREAIVAFDIFARQHWILPEGYGGAIPSKPPMLHWLIAFCSFFIGFSELSSRLPSTLAALGFGTFYFVFLKKHRGHFYAIVACMVLLFSFEWLRAAMSCRVDMVHSAALAAAVLYGFQHFSFSDKAEEDSTSLRSNLIVAGLLAVSFLAKGPVAVVLGTSILLGWDLYRNRAFSFQFLRNRAMPRTLWLVGVPTVAAGLWYGLAWAYGGQAFEAKFVEENLARFFGVMKKPAHEHGVFYLFGALLVGLLPWSLWLLAALWDKWRHKTPLELPMDELFKFCCLSAGAIFCFYSLPNSKRGVYLLAGYPFLVVLLMDLFAAFRDRLIFNYWYIQKGVCFLFLSVYFLIACLVFVNFIAGAPYTGGVWLRYPLFAGHMIITWSWWQWVVFLLPLAVVVLTLCEPLSLRIGEKVYADADVRTVRLAQIFGFMSLGVWAIQGAVLPVVAQELSLKSFGVVVESNVDHQKLGSYGMEFYNLGFYMDKPITPREGPFFDGDWVVLPAKKYSAFMKELGRHQSSTIVARGISGIKPGYEPLLVKVLQEGENQQKAVSKEGGIRY